MNVTISFDEHKVRNTEKIEDIKVLMLKGEKGDAGMTPEDVMDVVEPYLATYAPLNSPALTGTPTAPTATAGSDTTQIATTAYVKNEVDSKLSSTYKAKGSVAFASLPALIAANEGNVYNVTDAFTTTNDFVEGSGKSYPAGTNVVIVNTTGTTYKYDVLSGFVDLSGYLTSSDAANTYLSQSDASNTYLTQSDASSTYLTQSDASSTYLTQSDASSTYATQTALGNTDAKVGSGTLDIGSDLTDGVNQLNSNLTAAIASSIFGVNGEHWNTGQTSIDSLVDNIVTAGKYFSFDNNATASTPSTGANRQFGFGWTNTTKKYAWVILFSFSKCFIGKRNNATTFTWTEL